MLARYTAALLLLVVCTACSFAQSTPTGTSTANQPYARPDAATRQKRYLLGMFGPFSIAGDAASAAISTWNHNPPEWGKSWNGFGRNFASNLGKGVIKGSATFALEEAFKLDSHYYRSTKRDPGSRLRNVLVSAFTARKPDGKRVLGFPSIAGNYASGVIAVEAWYPRRLGVRDGLRMGSWGVVSDILSNLFKEFVHR